MPLSDPGVRNLKPAEKAYKKADFDNLYLLVKPSGAKLWRFDYRLSGIRRTLALGQYPDVPLAAARTARDQARQMVAAGKDPSTEKKAAKAQARVSAENTFVNVAESFLAKMAKDKKGERTIVKNRRWLMKHCRPLHGMPVTEIKPVHIVEIVNRIQAQGHVVNAKGVREVIGRVFQFAIANAMLEVDPTPAMRGAIQKHDVESFPGLTDPKEVGGLIRAIRGYDGMATIVGALKMQAYGFARPGETRQMEWSELDFKRNVWSISAHKAKLRRVQDVPLSNQMLEIIEDMRPLTGRMQYVFQSMWRGKTVISDNTMNSALRTMGYDTTTQHCAHGFRSTASTLLNASLKFPQAVIDAQMAHLDPHKTRRIYNRAEYWDERVTMMQWWGDYLDQLAAGRG